MTTQKQITFNDFDKLKLKSYGENLYQVIDKGLSSSIGEMGEKLGWTLSLNAPFGNGKTTFLKMFEHFIKTEKNQNKENQKQGYNILFINAWESDFYKEPVIAILSELIEWLNEDQTTKQKEEIINLVIGTIGLVGSIGINSGNQVIKYITGLDIKNATKEGLKDFKKFSCLKKIIKNKDALNQIIGQTLLDDFKKRKIAVQEVKNAISKYITASNKKLLIIVDELDRARPDYAVHFLEAMKHFFDIENVVFVVAVNRQQMEATVKCLYGQSLDFDGYYRKFFKQEMELPDPYKEAQKFVDDLIKKTKVKFNDTRLDQKERIKYIYTSCQVFKLTLREVETFAEIFGMILKDEKSIANWVYIDAYSFFICLFVKERTIFQKILDEKFNLDDFLKFSVEKKGVYNSSENYLLGRMACSFLKLRSDNLGIQFRTQSNKSSPFKEPVNVSKEESKISKAFPEIKKAMIESLTSKIQGGFDLNYGQPALNICETINKRQFT